MADVLHMVIVEPLVRIIIVKIRHPLIGLAAKFSQIMACRRAACEGQVDGNACSVKPSGHGHMVDTCDVLKGAKRGNLCIEPHHLIHVFPAKRFPEFLIFSAGLVLFRLLRGEKIKVHHRLKGESLPLLIKNKLKHSQIEQGPRRVIFRFLCKLLIGIQDMAHILIGKLHPPFSRLPANQAHGFPADLVDLLTLNSSFNRKNAAKLPFPVFPVHQHLNALPAEV